MAKQSGLGDNLIIDGFNVSGDVGSIDTIEGARAVQELTGLDKYAKERGLLVSDSKMEFTAYFNPPGSHQQFSALPQGDRLATYCRGTGLGFPAVTLTAKQTDYQGTRGDDGSLTFKVPLVGADGEPMTWGEQLTDGQETFTAGASTGSKDLGAVGTNVALIVHVMEFTGTDITITFEESSDDGAGDAWSPISGATATLTDNGAVKFLAPLTEQFIRATISGTFTTADLMIVTP